MTIAIWLDENTIFEILFVIIWSFAWFVGGFLCAGIYKE